MGGWAFLAESRLIVATLDSYLPCTGLGVKLLFDPDCSAKPVCVVQELVRCEAGPALAVMGFRRDWLLSRPQSEKPRPSK